MSGNPYISVNSASRKAEKAPRDRQSVRLCGFAKLKAKITKIAVLMITSGTTGAPKGVVTAHGQNLRTFETNLDTIVDLLGSIPDDRLVIAESGIHTPEDVRRMRDNGVHGFLVGEAFMRAEHPGERLAALFGH